MKTKLNDFLNENIKKILPIKGDFSEINYDDLDFDENVKYFKNKLSDSYMKPIVFSTNEGEKNIREYVEDYIYIYDSFTRMLETGEYKKTESIPNDKVLKKKIEKSKYNMELYKERLKVYSSLPRIDYMYDVYKI